MKPISRRLHSKKIRGIQYEIESCFMEDKNVFQKIGDMIKMMQLRKIIHGIRI